MGKIKDFLRDLFFIDNNNRIDKDDWKEIERDNNGEN